MQDTFTAICKDRLFMGVLGMRDLARANVYKNKLVITLKIIERKKNAQST